MKRLKSILPIWGRLKHYSKSTFRSDLIAGLTVGIMLVPQGMAYAYLAGMPPIYGLYGGLIPLFLYALFGTSNQLSIGPVAISALLVLAGVSQLAEPGTEAFINLVITAGLLIGILQFILSLLRMGFLVNFLSHPVIAGFTSAAAVIIAMNQLKDALGFDIPRFQHVHETLLYAIQHIDQTNWISLGICIGALALIVSLRGINRNIPGALIAVVLSILLTWGLDLETMGLAIIRDVPAGLPSFQFPVIEIETIRLLTPTVLTVTIIGIVESIGIARALESKHQDHAIRPNQELLALGISKIAGAFFQALPTSGSFSRSAINSDSGAKTGMASIFTVVLIVFTLLFLMPLFYYLPKAVLAAIILLAVKGLFDYKEAIHLWETHRQDFIMMLVTFIVTLLLGIEEGVMAGVLLSIFTVLYWSSRPHVAILGKMPGTTYYRNIDRFEEAEELEDGVIIRYDDQLYFGNAAFFKKTVQNLIQNRESKLKHFFLDAKSIHNIDSSGLNALKEIHQLLKKQEIDLYICGAIGPVRDLLDKSGFLEELGEEKHFIYLHDALEYRTKIK